MRKGIVQSDKLPASVTNTWKGILNACPTLEGLMNTIEDNFIDMICDPVIEHVSDHPATKEDMLECVDAILRGHFLT